MFHRDGGECRSCRRSLDRIVNPEVTERYDHIIPLAEGGANDVTNLQLLCDGCNSSKSSRLDPVSPDYFRAYPLGASNYLSDATPPRHGVLAASQEHQMRSDARYSSPRLAVAQRP
ncbi:HNH endonuclease [Paracoccus sp. R86501]|uniref:HNH endonuclease n=1 Tax=Paracoccus sp. R86501 TaxID=3101711 RepID=UPI00366F27D7